MTGLQFSTLASLIYGDGWRAETARLLKVSLRNVQHWAAGSKPIPPGVASEMIEAAGSFYACDPTRIDEIAEILRVVTGAE